MGVLYAYPKSCEFGRVVAKSKLFLRVRPSTKLRETFTQQIGQIRWSHKLYEKGLNLPNSKNVPEIQVFTIALKTQDYDMALLRHIDKAIAYPIIFELTFEGEINMIAAYKRPPEIAGKYWVCSEYFQTGWLPKNSARQDIPTALNLETLYTKLIRKLLPYPAIGEERLASQVERIALIKKQEKACQALKLKVDKEKQFNRRVEFNKALKEASGKLSELIHG